MIKQKETKVCAICGKHDVKLIKNYCVDCWLDMQIISYKQALEDDRLFIQNTIAGVVDPITKRTSLGSGNSCYRKRN